MDYLLKTYANNSSILLQNYANIINLLNHDVFPECVARVPVSFGGLGVRLCSRKVVSMFATVRNRSQPFATVRNRLRVRRKALHSGECVRSGPEIVSS